VVEQKARSLSELDSDIWRLFLYAMKSPITRDKYQRRLSKFFGFAEIQGVSLQEKALSFVQAARTDSSWVFTMVLRFLELQNARVNNREITGSSYVRKKHRFIRIQCSGISKSSTKYNSGPYLNNTYRRGL
jgi:hypothetical protein